MIMSDVEQQCIVAGRRYNIGCDLTNDVPDVVAAFVRVFENHVVNNNNNPESTCRLLNTFLTDGDLYLRLFIAAGGVLDVVFLQILSFGVDVLATSDVLFATMNLVFDTDVNLPHFVCGLAPLLIRACNKDGHVWRILELSTRISHVDSLKDMIRDVEFFRNLLFHMSRDVDMMVDVLHLVEPFVDDVHSVDDIIRYVIMYLGRIWTNYETEPSRYAVHFLTTCFRKNSAIRDSHAHLMVNMWRTGWNPCMGDVLAYQLDTTSVEFVVLLEKKNKFEDFVKLAYGRTLISWRVVRYLIHYHWPEQVARIMNLDDETHFVTADDVCCPITQTPMARPVVASDGHTYERGAIIQHMVTLGLWSPVTRLPLSYHLYDNRLLRG